MTTFLSLTNFPGGTSPPCHPIKAPMVKTSLCTLEHPSPSRRLSEKSSIWRTAYCVMRRRCCLFLCYTVVVIFCVIKVLRDFIIVVHLDRSSFYSYNFIVLSLLKAEIYSCSKIELTNFTQFTFFIFLKILRSF